MKVRILTTCAASLLFATALQAQAHPIVGKWAIEYPGGMRNDNGVVTAVVAKGTLTVEAVGDSLVATLVTAPADSSAPPRKPLTLSTARPTGGDVTFTHRANATLRMGGEETTRTSIATWIMKVEGDSLTGTLERAIEGVEMMAGGPQPLKATRIKAAG